MKQAFKWVGQDVDGNVQEVEIGVRMKTVSYLRRQEAKKHRDELESEVHRLLMRYFKLRQIRERK